MTVREDVAAFKEACGRDVKSGVDYLFFTFLPKGDHETKAGALAGFVHAAAPLCGGASFQSPQSVETVIRCIPDSPEKSALRETAKFFGLHA